MRSYDQKLMSNLSSELACQILQKGFMKGKKVLVVGGTGFIGYHLLKLCLLKKIDVSSVMKRAVN